MKLGKGEEVRDLFERYAWRNGDTTDGRAFKRHSLTVGIWSSGSLIYMARYDTEVDLFNFWIYVFCFKFIFRFSSLQASTFPSGSFLVILSSQYMVITSSHHLHYITHRVSNAPIFPQEDIQHHFPICPAR